MDAAEAQLATPRSAKSPSRISDAVHHQKQVAARRAKKELQRLRREQHREARLGGSEQQGSVRNERIQKLETVIDDFKVLDSAYEKQNAADASGQPPAIWKVCIKGNSGKQYEKAQKTRNVSMPLLPACQSRYSFRRYTILRMCSTTATTTPSGGQQAHTPVQQTCSLMSLLCGSAWQT